MPSPSDAVRDDDDAAVDRIRAQLERYSGMSLQGTRRADLLRVLDAGIREERLQRAGDLERMLADPKAGPRLRDRLIARLTVPESSFFRDPAQIEALERHILPALLASATAEGRPVVIWSAGCSTGEEPYTLAMLLDRLSPGFDERRARIVATDINPKSLEHAKRGHYSDWSLRQTPREMREAYFAPHGRLHELSARIRSRVTFACENLATNGGSLVSPGSADLILCRNVMIYLRTDACEQLAERFAEALRPGGWLIVAPAELSAEIFRRFATVPFPGTYFYRKDPGPAPNLPTPTATPAPPIVSGQGGGTASESGAAPRSFEEVRAILDRDPEADGPDRLSSWTDRHPELPIAAWTARAMTARGDFARGLEWVDRAIASDPVSAPLHHLRGLILTERGEIDAAIDAFRRCLFADHEFIIGHFHHAELLRRAGKGERARAALDSLRRLLVGKAPDEPIPEGDGLTVGQIREWLDSEGGQ